MLSHGDYSKDESQNLFDSSLTVQRGHRLFPLKKFYKLFRKKIGGKKQNTVTHGLSAVRDPMYV